jgi:predicted HAD superfamily Cof-like phosphohydrolase
VALSNYDKVQEFHRHFDIPEGVMGNIPTAERSLLRTRLMMSELAELIESMQLGDYVNMAKELADVLYVVYGTAYEAGLPIDDIFEAVHQSNMTKSSDLDGGGKVIKGDTYEAPDIEAVLKKAMED